MRSPGKRKYKRVKTQYKKMRMRDPSPETRALPAQRTRVHDPSCQKKAGHNCVNAASRMCAVEKTSQDKTKSWC